MLLGLRKPKITTILISGHGILCLKSPEVIMSFFAKNAQNLRRVQPFFFSSVSENKDTRTVFTPYERGKNCLSVGIKKVQLSLHNMFFLVKKHEN